MLILDAVKLPPAYSTRQANMNSYVCTGSSCSNLSDNSENSTDETLSPVPRTDGVCRDFMRNVCRRGSHCRYHHPDAEEARRLGLHQQEFLFCHDFQNTGCQRGSCRFIHCSREEEELFRRTGELPVHLAQAAALGLISSEPGLVKGKAPACKDFMKGECRRGAKCKYRHLTAAAYEQELLCDRQQVLPPAAVIVPELGRNVNLDESLTKKRRIGDAGDSSEYYDTSRIVTLTDYQLLMEENQLLRCKVDDLKRHLSVRVATNELLLEQNARYRACKLITVPPIVAVSQMLTSTITPAPTASRPTAVTALHQGPHGITTMATVSRVTINGNREIVMSQPTLHSLVHQPVNMSVAPPLPAINPTASMAIVPMTIPMCAASMTPIAGSNLAAVSLPQGQQPQPMTAMNIAPQQSLPSIIANMPNSNFVSYPIMSQTQLSGTSLG